MPLHISKSEVDSLLTSFITNMSPSLQILKKLLFPYHFAIWLGLYLPKEQELNIMQVPQVALNFSKYLNTHFTNSFYLR